MCPLETSGSESRTPQPNNTPVVPKQKHRVRFQFHPYTFDKTHNYLPSAPFLSHTCPRERDFQLRYLWTCILMIPWSLFVLWERSSCHHMSNERGIAVPNRSPRYFPTHPHFLSSDEVLRFDGLRHCLSALNICKNIKLSKSWLTFHRPPVDLRFSHHYRSAVTTLKSTCHATMCDACKWSKAERRNISGPPWLLRNNWQGSNLQPSLAELEHWDVLQAEPVARPLPCSAVVRKVDLTYRKQLFIRTRMPKGPGSCDVLDPPARNCLS